MFLQAGESERNRIDRKMSREGQVAKKVEVMPDREVVEIGKT